MTYRRLMDNSLMAVLVGLACLVLGYMIGRQGPIPVAGVDSVSAESLQAENNY